MAHTHSAFSVIVIGGLIGIILLTLAVVMVVRMRRRVQHDPQSYKNLMTQQ